jgi:hypothetical protein
LRLTAQGYRTLRVYQSESYQCVKIIAEIETYPGLAYRFHAAFERGVLDRVGIMGNYPDEAENQGNGYHQETESDSDQEEQSYITIVCKQLSSSPAGVIEI